MSKVHVYPHGETARERQVLDACLRLGNKGAAYELGVSIKTIKHHNWCLFRKLDVSTRDEAAVVIGWLTLPE
jgi:DNA-binding NarL/FixJ family response regulator